MPVNNRIAQKVLNSGLVFNLPMLSGGANLLDLKTGKTFAGTSIPAGVLVPFPHPMNNVGGAAMNLNGVGYYSLSTPNIAPLNDVTVAYFYNTSNIINYYDAFNLYNGSAYIGVFGVYGGLMGGYAVDSSNKYYQYNAGTATNQINIVNQWNYICQVFNSTTHTWKTYGGSLTKWEGSMTISGTASAVRTRGTATVASIGSEGGATPWPGYLGPLYVFNRQLNQNEAWQIWNDPYAPVRDKFRVFRLPPASGTLQTITLSANQGNSAGLIKSPFKIFVLTVGNTPAIAKTPARSFTATSVNFPTVAKTPLKSLAATTITLVPTALPNIVKALLLAASSATLASLLKKPFKAFSATLGEVPTLAKTPLKALSATKGNSPTISRTPGKAVSASQGSSPTIAKTPGKSLASTALTLIATLVRSTLKALSTTTGNSPVLARAVSRSFNAGSTLVPTIVKSVVKAFSTSSATSAAISTIRFKLLTLSTSLVTSASLAKSPLKALVAATSNAASLTKKPFKALAGAVGQSSSLVRSVARSLTAGSTLAATIAKSVSPQPIVATVGKAASIIKSVATARSATTTSQGATFKQPQVARAATTTLIASLTTLKVRVLTLTASTGGFVASVVRSVGKTNTANTTSAPSLSKSVSTTRSATSTTSASVTKKPMLVRLATSALAAVANAVKSGGATTYNLALSATVGTSTAVSRQVGKVVNAAEITASNLVKSIGKSAFTAPISGNPSLNKQPRVTRAAALVFSASLTTVKVKLLQLAASVGSSAATIKAPLKTASSTLNSVSSLIKQSRVTRSAATGAAPQVTKQPRILKTATGGLVASAATVRVKLLNLVASIGSTVSVSKQAGKSFSAGAALINSLSRQIKTQFVAQESLTGSLSKFVSKTFLANPVFSAIVTAIKLVPAAQSAIVATIRLGSHAVAATVRMSNEAVAAAVGTDNRLVAATVKMARVAVGAVVNTDIVQAIVSKVKFG